MRKIYLRATLLLLLIAAGLFSRGTPDFKYGFGAGINFSQINEVNSYSLFEDLSGAEYSSQYSGLFSNLGSLYFFHGEFVFDQIALTIKPGFYTYNFNKTDEVIFNSETIEHQSSYLVRYMSLPLEAKWLIGRENFRPFIGGSVSYSHLLRQGGSGNHSFIKPRLSGGPIAGGYYGFKSFELVFTGGYDYNFHIITNKDDRYSTTSSTPYSQSDVKLHALHFSVSVLFSLGKSDNRKGLECKYPKR